MRLAIVIIVGLLSSLSPWNAEAQEASAHFGADAHAALGAYRGMVEEHTEGIRRSLRIIADSSEAKSGKWESFKPLLMQLSSDLTTDATAWFVLPDGSYFATEAGGMTEQNLKDREYFPALMSGKEVFGDLVISKSTGHRSVIIAVPVRSGEKVIGGVGVSMRVLLLSELVDQHMSLPPNTYFYALERDTRIVLHRYAERMFKMPSDVGDESLGEEFKRALTKDSGSMEYTLQGKKIAAIFQLSKTLGWYFFIAKEM